MVNNAIFLHVSNKKSNKLNMEIIGEASNVGHSKMAEAQGDMVPQFLNP